MLARITERRSEQVVVFHLKRVVYPCCKFIRAREVSGVARTQIMQTNKPQRHFSKSAFDAGNFLLRPIPRAATFAPAQDSLSSVSVLGCDFEQRSKTNARNWKKKHPVVFVFALFLSIASLWVICLRPFIVRGRISPLAFRVTDFTQRAHEISAQLANLCFAASALIQF